MFAPPAVASPSGPARTKLPHGHDQPTFDRYFCILEKKQPVHTKVLEETPLTKLQHWWIPKLGVLFLLNMKGLTSSNQPPDL